ncbi:MarR family winged helix-turn-helix transcriptional regulator [Enterocloster bolteae]|uniref:MarR family winged helix-turn-helix transcriptional regulator n=1 Tax=Enterocloster bolteae TaxID=208479 RepID=UPI002A829179|nr:MarR family winged helix-turn-helix transcriptional regulator [Enterocloster bolteae]
MNYNALVILYTLDDYKTCTQKQICDWWALPKQTVHGILLDFEKKGYITITSNDKNKRERLIAFTEKGKLFAASVLDKLYEMEENAMQKMSYDQRNQLVTCSTKYYELLKEEIEHGPYIMN